MSDADTAAGPEEGKNFIEDIIDGDNASGKHGGQVVTRFPPEPNGYLHIGHAKSICLNFGLGQKYGGRTHLRFDDTNPMTEDVEYVDSIKGDVQWLGYDWGEHLYFASDYFDRLYLYAEELMKLGKAYVDSLSPEEVQAYRGDFHTPGKNSPYRDRSVDENLALFREMKAGTHAEGTHTVRLKIDMTSGNPNLRDPPIYRIRHAHHHRTGDAWHIYPLYDYTHCVSDAIEGITHSICTLEFEAHRPLYDWVLAALREIPAGAPIAPPPGNPQQIEFARLNLNYTVMSKRRLLVLVNDGHVDGWDDPRMLTISGLRRRGYTPGSVRRFASTVGIAKSAQNIDMSILESCVREDLNVSAPRAMAVLNPLRVIIDNYEGDGELVDLQNHPLSPELGTRQVPFGKEIFIEAEDFMEVAPKGYFRLQPGKEVRLRGAYFIKAESVDKDADGNVVAVHCTYDKTTKGGNALDGRKVKGTIHWVSATAGVKAEVRLFDRLFSVPQPGAGDRDFRLDLNPESKVSITAIVEPMLKTATGGQHFQFERVGYFYVDAKDSAPGAPVFHRVVGLKDSWAKEQKKA
jgi:glutaminyl-tRNA synthetase